jgi:hypothetical protein
LQSAERFLRDALTFIVVSVFLFVSETDSSFGQVVRGHFHLHFVTGENLDVVHTHFTGDVGNDLMPIL